MFIFQHNLSKELFDRMIEAREIFLEDDVKPPYFTIEDVESYSEKAFSPVYYLLLESLGSTEINGHARHAANQVRN